MELHIPNPAQWSLCLSLARLLANSFPIFCVLFGIMDWAPLSSAGIPVMYSTIALMMGFWVLTISSYLPVIRFRLLSGIAFIAGLVDTLLILPTVIVLARRGRWRRPIQP